MGQLPNLQDLWLQSPGRCQLQFCVKRDGDMLEDEYTLDHIARKIAAHPVRFSSPVPERTQST
ncbi:uncharacterized protein B0I36DRAFT_309976 [Microdochium trichocladiopsis]|uniref:Uncharacterized protein n=1 Tax=Microdochium trichocladiopsis TaxID=1682393 RepID=A0A9P9BVC8_9PEZI|nr:uncharacterized protein B0I36DRAFT_309976 [Microdochium trichocladiopsis]KAH7040123.1 hypothetical protein B0I36DRAFT_309976 [Microdochium trichocladiopsis]